MSHILTLLHLHQTTIGLWSIRSSAVAAKSVHLTYGSIHTAQKTF